MDRLKQRRKSTGTPSDDAPTVSTAARNSPQALSSSSNSSAASASMSPRTLVSTMSPSALRVALRARARALLVGDENRSLRAALKAEMQKPRRVQLVDKLSFTLGVINLCATEAVMLLAPSRFWAWYAAWSVPLLAWRFWSYTRKRWHYFLVDFCYFVNGLCLLHLFVLPHSRTLFELAFMTSNGPLAWAIIAWRNSLVFHDLDKITSLFIHAMPPLLMYAQRWHFQRGHHGELPAYLQCPPATQAEAACAKGYWETLTLPLLFYVAWQVGYFLKTEWWDGAALRLDPDIQTSLRWLARSTSGVMHSVARGTMLSLGLMTPDERFDSETVKTKAVFMAFQLVYTLVTLLPTRAMYDSQAVHLAFLSLWGLAAVWHGSAYYIDVFSRKYIQEIEAALLDSTVGAATPSGGSAASTSTGAGAPQPSASAPSTKQYSPAHLLGSIPEKPVALMQALEVPSLEGDALLKQATGTGLLHMAAVSSEEIQSAIHSADGSASDRAQDPSSVATSAAGGFDLSKS